MSVNVMTPNGVIKVANIGGGSGGASTDVVHIDGGANLSVAETLYDSDELNIEFVDDEEGYVDYATTDYVAGRISALPAIIVSTEEPTEDVGKNGDIWVVVEE